MAWELLANGSKGKRDMARRGASATPVPEFRRGFVPMKAEELMIRKFETVQADAGVEEVALKLRAANLDVLPVCRDGLLVGLVTHGDLTMRVAPWKRRAEPTRVSDVISPDILFCFENTEVNEAAKLMRENRISRLPVLDRSKAVVGVLVLRDIPAEQRGSLRTQPAT